MGRSLPSLAVLESPQFPDPSFCELTGAFNAEVNANLRVGALEETITVSGASPVVDVKSTLTQSVLTKKQIEILGGARTLKGRAALIPGVVVPNNITPYLNSIGLKYAPQLFFYDFNPGVGGPIKKDKLWYFAAFTGQNQNSQILDIYFKPEEASTPTECRNRAAGNLCLAYTGAHFDSSETVRVTHQMTSKHKLRYSLDNTRYVRQRGNFSTGGLRVSPEASWYLPLYPTYVAQATLLSRPQSAARHRVRRAAASISASWPFHPGHQRLTHLHRFGFPG